MKITVGNKNNKLLKILKPYLQASARLRIFSRSILMVLSVFFNRIRTFSLKLFVKTLKFGLNFVLLLIMVFYILIILGNIYDTYKSDTIFAKTKVAYEAYDYADKPVPNEILENLILSCTTKKIDLSKKNKVYSTDVSITNNNNQEVFFGNPKAFALIIRPRMWTGDKTTVVRDGIAGGFSSRLIKIDPNSTHRSTLYIPTEIIESVPKNAKFLIYDIVLEHVAWLGQNGCSIEMSHEK